MPPCLSHITCTYTSNKKPRSIPFYKRNRSNNDKNDKNDKTSTSHKETYIYNNINLNVHTVAQLDFILFQQVF
jgi:hypothetical protein